MTAVIQRGGASSSGRRTTLRAAETSREHGHDEQRDTLGGTGAGGGIVHPPTEDEPEHRVLDEPHRTTRGLQRRHLHVRGAPGGWLTDHWSWRQTNHWGTNMQSLQRRSSLYSGRVMTIAISMRQMKAVSMQISPPFLHLQPVRDTHLKRARMPVPPPGLITDNPIIILRHPNVSIP